eukprot:TRINITY_DN2087_c0_g1_i1.p1 TRINITY_DN2087_c0_g1~~TRINITY_DN2087_c0_g1_i1.p1  ORF type:complete len:163 (-),score=19.38 TRINITY_DN2087_c0_g1_i1:147-635(-)
MAGISSFQACRCEQKAVVVGDRGLGFSSRRGIDWRAKARSLRPFHGETQHLSRLTLSHPRRASLDVSQSSSCIRMTLVDERLTYGPNVAKPSGELAYDLVQGALVRWSSFMDKSIPDPPTAVLLHGILGSRKNWGKSFFPFKRQFVSLSFNTHFPPLTVCFF